MRRISTGQVGDTLLGKLVVEDQTLKPLESSDILLLQGSRVDVDVDLAIIGDNSLRIYEGANSSNYVSINSPSLSGNVNFTLPSADGSTGTVLSTDGSGNLSFQDVAVSITNQTADTASYFPLMTTSTSGLVNDISVSNSKLSFQPSSGTLTVSALSSSNVNIDGGNIDGTVIGANNAATGTFTSITETSSIIYKQQIEPIDHALDLINQLQGVTYYRKDNLSTKEAGLIAEEVSDIVPELVKYKHGKPDGINYTKITAYLIESIKTLTQELNKLQNKNYG